MLRSLLVFVGTMMLGTFGFRLAFAVVNSLNGNVTLFWEAFLPWGVLSLLTASVLFAVAIHKAYT